MTPQENTVSIEELLDHADWVRRLAARLVSEADLDDVVQDTWLRALNSPPRSKGNLRGWLRTVVVNVVRGRARSRQRRAFREEHAARPEALPPTDEVVAEARLQRDLADRVLALEEPYRSVLLKRFFRDESPRRIAHELQRPLATVRTQIQRGLERLRRDLDRDYGDRRSWCLALTGLIPQAGPMLPALALVTAAGVGGVLLWFGMRQPETTHSGMQALALRPEAIGLPPRTLGPGLSPDSAPALEPGERRTAGDAVHDARPATTESMRLYPAPRRSSIFGRLVDLAGVPIEGEVLRWVDPGALRWADESRTIISGPNVWLPVSKARQAELRTNTKALEAFVHRYFSRPDLARALLLDVAPPIFEATSDAKGEFALVVPAIGSRMELVDSTYSLVGRGSARRGLPGDALTYFASEGVAVRGRVVDEAGEPWQHARIEVDAYAPPRVSEQLSMGSGLLCEVHETRTDIDGFFELARVPRIWIGEGQSSPMLRATVDDGREKASRLPSTPEEELRIVVPRRPQQPTIVVAGRALRPDGSPARYAHAYLGDVRGAVDQDGRFELEVREPAANEALRLVSPGYGPVEIADYGAQLAGRQGVQLGPTLTLKGRAASIAGRVLRADGRPAAGLEVRLANPTRGGDERSLEALVTGRSGPVLTQSDGSFSIGGLFQRTYKLRVRDGERVRETAPIAPNGPPVRLEAP